MRNPSLGGVRGATDSPGQDNGKYTTAGSSLKQRPRQAQAAELLTLLREEYPVLAEFRPLAIGIHVTLRRVGVSNKLLRRALARHCGQRRYLQALAAGGARFALDGTACGEVTELQREVAKAKLERAAAKPDPLLRIPVLSLPKRRVQS